MKKVSQILDQTQAIFKDRPKNLSKEFQVYGVYLAEALGDTKHYSLYIKLAKTLPRHILDEALTFCKEYRNARSKGKIFMWKLEKLKQQLKEATV
ncbi:hypothetical protein HYS91_02490 [Candidatus Daviesbacteria bacterium]|nr:hypothetical protein [Candidatus Daviesbacteria bacterium]